MPKNKSFRFAIADQKPRSECWSVFTNRNDVYLTTSAFKQVLKVSLHESGVCQTALLENFFAEHVEWRADRPEFRSILRWKRLPTPEGKGIPAASILFASAGFWPEQEEIPSHKSFTPLEPPPEGYGQMVHVIFSYDDPNQVAEWGGWTDRLLFSVQLPNKEFVCLMQELAPLPEGFFDFAPMEAKYGLSLGIPENELEDARGISCFSCDLLFEGCGCIRSLHNMRLMKVAKVED